MMVTQNRGEDEYAVTCKNKRLWTSLSTTDSARTWQLAAIDLHDQGESDYKLILEGTIPAGYPDARICVDNITSYTEPCSALQKVSKVVASQWTWAQYFGITFVTALVLGLTIPILFLVILIWACRRRHNAPRSPYTDNKLFSTNLWYYIGGKEICDDPTGFRGSASLVRSNKHHGSSGTGTLLFNGGQQGPDMMDLPDVVIPGGRVVSFNYPANTMGPAGTLRHPSQSNSPAAQPAHNMPSQSVTAGIAQTHNMAMPIAMSTHATQMQENLIHLQQNQLQANVTNQLPVLMTQSVAPNYGLDSNGALYSDAGVAIGGSGQFNTYTPSMAMTTQQQQQQQPPQQQQQQQPLPFMQQAPNTVSISQSVVQPQIQLTTAVSQQQILAQQQVPVQQHQHAFSQPQQQTIPQQQIVQPQLAMYPQQQQPVSVPTSHQQLQQQPYFPQQQPVVFPQPSNQPALQQQRLSIIQPMQQLPQQQQQLQQQAQRQQQFGNQASMAQIAPSTLLPPQQQQQPLTTAPSSQQNNSSVPASHDGYATGAQMARVFPSQRSPVQNDSLTEADQQAAMAALFAATEDNEPIFETHRNPVCENGSDRDGCGIYVDASRVCSRDDHPPPGYDEAVGLVGARVPPNGCPISAANSVSVGLGTMAKPALPSPITTTPPPALPPRRVVNGMGLDDVDDFQSTNCLSLAERYGLPVAEI